MPQANTLTSAWLSEGRGDWQLFTDKRAADFFQHHGPHGIGVIIGVIFLFITTSKWLASQHNTITSFISLYELYILM
jgi:heme/copper-type cytochrome/quinol oxidase subunit 3